MINSTNNGVFIAVLADAKHAVEWLPKNWKW